MNLYDELLQKGRQLSKEQRAEAMKYLLLSPSAPALVVSVRELWEGYARSASTQKLAPHHGCLEHCAGSLHGVETVENFIRGAAGAIDKELEAKQRRVKR